MVEGDRGSYSCVTVAWATAPFQISRSKMDLIGRQVGLLTHVLRKLGGITQ